VLPYPYASLNLTVKVGGAAFAESKDVQSGVAPVTGCTFVGSSLDAEPTVNSQDELSVATCGSHNLRRRSNR